MGWTWSTVTWELHIQEADVERVFFNKLATRFDFVTHEHTKHIVRGTDVAMLTWISVRFAGSSVVSRNSSGFISPRPLNRVTCSPFSPAERMAGNKPRRSRSGMSESPRRNTYRGSSIPVRSCGSATEYRTPSWRVPHARVDRAHFVQLGDMHMGLLVIRVSRVRSGHLCRFIHGEFATRLRLPVPSGTPRTSLARAASIPRPPRIT